MELLSIKNIFLQKYPSFLFRISQLYEHQLIYDNYLIVMTKITHCQKSLTMID